MPVSGNSYRTWFHFLCEPGAPLKQNRRYKTSPKGMSFPNTALWKLLQLSPQRDTAHHVVRSLEFHVTPESKAEKTNIIKTKKKTSLRYRVQDPPQNHRLLRKKKMAHLTSLGLETALTSLGLASAGKRHSSAFDWNPNGTRSKPDLRSLE